MAMVMMPASAGDVDGRGAVGSAPTHTESTVSKIPHVLPHERVFPIQIGSELFKLSGASLSSDAPSYFSQYFRCQIDRAEEAGEDVGASIKTLYIDRDPSTFRDISLHLQGYHVTPRDGTHFVRLFADAQFYSLPRFVAQLYEESIFVSVGGREFQIPRDVFSDPGNSPNFFSLGFAVFFSRPDDLFPGLPSEGLIRPPSILPPAVPNRDPDVFAELLRLLRGYPLRVRDAVHRQQLLREARYFHFKGLEQRLIAHAISYNQLRQREEIALRLENVQKSGVSVVQGRPDAEGEQLISWVSYARPFVDERPAELILEIGGESTRLHFSSGSPRAEFFRDTKSRVARLFEVVATKLNLPPTTQPLGLLMASGGAGSQPATPGNTPLSEDLVRVAFEPESAVILDGKEVGGETAAAAAAAAAATLVTAAASTSTPTGESPASNNGDAPPNPRKRRRTENGSIVGGGPEEWVVRTGQWRLRIQPTRGGKSAVECVLVAVKIDAVTAELGRNMQRAFLGD